ncbi:MAG: sodium:solute symporter family protein, partial [Myxococcota bacterium]|nr:sodium:solute symporter family protein [Myxococcota bacterium]
FVYQYLVGGFVFAIGLSYAWRQGRVGLRGTALRNRAMALGGLAFFAALQGYLQYGEMGTVERIGSAGDLSDPLCPYPCEERFPAGASEQPRPAAELDKIESILTVERDLSQARAEHKAGVLSDESLAAEEEAILARRELGTPLDYSIMVAYFVLMLVIGTWFGRNNKDTKDFFFGGQRFSWWLISFSLVATTVGSYSFVKYSKVAFGYGIASSQTYLNDWFWMPFLVFGWLPILYFSRLVSIPEYFERRYNQSARRIATYLILAYLVGYVGINLFTMGKALNALVGWPIFGAAVGVATVSAAYVTFGGQTSVIMTDLFQGVMLLATGLVLLWLGMDYLGGAGAFWESLPRSHRTAFVGFNEGGAIYGKAGDASYHSVGIFWQDAMANSAMFYFLNQGMVMRLMAARSVKDSRRSVLSMFLILMPIAAVVVASGGWVGKALVHSGAVPAEMEASRAFYDAAYILTQPGIFGLIMAALTAALMSTVDTLVTAVSAIVVNDIYKPRNPEASEAQLLSMARKSAFGVMVFGVALVPLFASFDSIYSAHGAFTAAMTPPLVVTLLLGIFWRGFPARVAVWTMVGGMAAIAFSLFVPEVIAPFAHGVPAREAGEGLFGGMDTYKFMRACYGIVVCLGIAFIGTMMTGREERDDLGGLVWGTMKSAIASYKGSPGEDVESAWAEALPQEEQISVDGLERHPEAGLPYAWVSEGSARALGGIEVGDLLYVSDRRAWLGGLRSGHVLVGQIRPGDEARVGLPSRLHKAIVPPGRSEVPLRLKRLY